MSETVGITPSEFSTAFVRFLNAMNVEAAKASTPLLDRLSAHLGGEPARIPIISEEFEGYEHPNVQVALDKVLYAGGRTAELVGITAQNKRFGQFSFSDLFELLNQLDGLEDDADVLVILTTNRPDILEPALAARPGRIDLVAELPIPDAEGRARLLQLHARGLEFEGVDFARCVEKTEGASPA